MNSDAASLVAAKGLVLEAIQALFERRDLSAIERHWSAGYREHSAVGRSGLAGLKEAVQNLPDGFRHAIARVIGDGDLVAAHGVYYGFGPVPVVAFDVWRVDEDKIVEHWDAHQPWVESTVSGHSMIDGPTEVTDRLNTGANRRLVADFVELIMMGGDRSQLGRFFAGDHFVQHNPHIADGVSGLGQAIQAGVWEAVVERVHALVADGEFVFTMGEGQLHGKPTVFHDLFRVETDKLVEHWDVVFTKPAALAHDNGLF